MSKENQAQHVQNTLIMPVLGPATLNGKKIHNVSEIEVCIRAGEYPLVTLIIDLNKEVHFVQLEDRTSLYLQNTVIHNCKRIKILPGDYMKAKIVFPVHKIQLEQIGSA